MAFNKYKNGAWQEPEDSVRRYENGAWTECESAKSYKSSAWEEVWTAFKRMYLVENGIATNGFGLYTGWNYDADYVGVVKSQKSSTPQSLQVNKTTGFGMAVTGRDLCVEVGDTITGITLRYYKNGADSMTDISVTKAGNLCVVTIPTDRDESKIMYLNVIANKGKAVIYNIYME